MPCITDIPPGFDDADEGCAANKRGHEAGDGFICSCCGDFSGIGAPFIVEAVVRHGLAFLGIQLPFCKSFGLCGDIVGVERKEEALVMESAEREVGKAGRSAGRLGSLARNSSDRVMLMSAVETRNLVILTEGRRRMVHSRAQQLLHLLDRSGIRHVLQANTGVAYTAPEANAQVSTLDCPRW